MAQSIFVGQPAATTEEYWISKGVLQAMGKSEADPWHGVPIPPKRHRFLDSIIMNHALRASFTSYSNAIVLLRLFTSTRLYLRAFNKRIRWGLVDWLMVPAFESESHIKLPTLI